MKIRPEDIGDYKYEQSKEDAMILHSAEEVDLDMFMDELRKQEEAEQDNDEDWFEYMAIEEAKNRQEVKKILNRYRVTLDGIIKTLEPKYKEPK